jgi:hypothetical protein
MTIRLDQTRGKTGTEKSGGETAKLKGIEGKFYRPWEQKYRACKQDLKENLWDNNEKMGKAKSKI